MAPGAPACVLRCMDGAARVRSHIPRGGATLPWGGAVVNQLLLQHGRHGQGVHYCWRSQQDNRRKPRHKPETSRTALCDRTPPPSLPCASQECRYATFQAGTQHQCDPPTHPEVSADGPLASRASLKPGPESHLRRQPAVAQPCAQQQQLQLQASRRRRPALNCAL